MPLATYKDLCVDAVDAHRLGAFWAATLGLTLEQRDGQVLLAGPGPEHTVWVNQVPEPVTVKQRVHLDVHAGTVDEVLARGATPVDLTSFRWKVLRDPEGGELCVFEREEVPDQRLYAVVVDCAGDPRELATWWAGLLGGTVDGGAGGAGDDGGGWASVDDVPGAPFEGIVFVPVPEPKTVKNRIHLDVTATDGIEPLLAHGATVLRGPGAGSPWTVLADPEGNEFCAFPGDER